SCHSPNLQRADWKKRVEIVCGDRHAKAVKSELIAQKDGAVVHQINHMRGVEEPATGESSYQISRRWIDHLPGRTIQEIVSEDHRVAGEERNSAGYGHARAINRHLAEAIESSTSVKDRRRCKSKMKTSFFVVRTGFGALHAIIENRDPRWRCD